MHRQAPRAHSLAHAVNAIGTSVWASIARSFDDYPTLKPMGIVWLASSVTTDILLTLGLSWTLKKVGHALLQRIMTDAMIPRGRASSCRRITSSIALCAVRRDFVRGETQFADRISVSVQNGDIAWSHLPLVPYTHTSAGLLTSLVALTDLVLFVVLGSPSHSE
jgi:hypothetical protein